MYRHRTRRISRTWGFPALAVVLPATGACSGASTRPAAQPAKTAKAADPQKAPQPQGPLPESRLKPMLLKAADLGTGYTEEPGDSPDKDEYGVTGCPALEKPSATDGELKSAVQVKTGFAYTDEAGLSEELDSDSPTTLSTQLRTRWTVPGRSSSAHPAPRTAAATSAIFWASSRADAARFPDPPLDPA